MQSTTNYNLNKPDDNDYVRIEVLNANADIIDAELKNVVRHVDYAVASGTNTYTATIDSIDELVEGMSLKIKFTNANTGASTLNINNSGAKSILKGNGDTLVGGNIKANQILHLAYNGSVFQLLGEGGSGNAQPEDVRVGKTFTNDSGEFIGTGVFKKWASGTAQVTSEKIVVSGLSFRPSMVLAKSTIASHDTTSRGNMDYISVYVNKDVFGLVNDIQGATYTAISSGTTHTITSNGFTLGVQGTASYDWIAFE